LISKCRFKISKDFIFFKLNKTRKFEYKKKELSFFLHLIVFDKYNKLEIDARKKIKETPMNEFMEFSGFTFVARENVIRRIFFAAQTSL